MVKRALVFLTALLMFTCLFTDAIKSDFLLSVSEVITRDVLDILAVNLDRTAIRAIKTWEHLACTEEINAPLEIRLKCKLNIENSCTFMLFEKLSSDVEYKDQTVMDLLDGVKKIGRNDVGEIIKSEACQGMFKLHPLYIHNSISMNRIYQR